MKDTEFISFYNNLDQYAKDKINRLLIDLTNAKKESRNYCIKVCPKCGAVDLGFTKGGNANSSKPMLKCRCCHKRFTYDNGQLTHNSHQDESKLDQLIVDTFSQVPIEKSAANMNISTYTVWRMRMKLLHILGKMIADTVVFEEIELDEKYILNSHKGENIDDLKPRKRGGSASKRGLSSEQICLPTTAQTSEDLMKLSNHIGENSMTWIDEKTAYNSLLLAKHCEMRVMKDHATYTSINHINNVNAFQRFIEKWHKRYNGVVSKYINRYAALFTLVREYMAVMHRNYYYQSRKECIRLQNSSVLLT